MDSAVEMMGASRIERANFHTTVVTELHIVHGWCPSLMCRLRSPIDPRSIVNDMESRVVVDYGEHAALRNSPRGLGEVCPLRVSFIAASASTSTSIDIAVARTGDDTYTEVTQHD
jgi:hypothetical protein